MHGRVAFLTGVACVLLTFTAYAADSQPVVRMGNQANQFMMEKITVANLRRSFDFYTKTVGLKEIEWPGQPKPNIDDTEASLIEVCLNFSGSAADPFVCLLKLKGLTPDPEHAKLVWVCFKTSDTRSALDRVRAAGFKVDFEATKFEGLVIGWAHDPDGYFVEFLEGKSVAR